MIWKRCKYIVPILVVMLIIAGLCGCSETERPKNKVVSGTDSRQRIAEIDPEEDSPAEKQETPLTETTDYGSDNDNPVPDTDKTDKTPGTSKDGDDSTSMAFSVHYIDVGQGDCTLVCCNGRSMLAHSAYRMGEVAVNNILGKRDVFRGNAVPSVVQGVCHAGRCPHECKFGQVHAQRCWTERQGYGDTDVS